MAGDTRYPGGARTEDFARAGGGGAHGGSGCPQARGNGGDRANQAETAAEQRLADSLLAQGDALAAADRWDQARVHYREAETDFQKLGAASFPTQLALWETYRRSPPPLISLIGHKAAINDVRFLPDGIHVLSIGADHTIKEWDGRLGIQTRSMDGGPPSTSCAVISADGDLIFMGSESGALTLWDWQRGQTVRTWPGHKVKVECVAISADGQIGVSGATDGSVKCWDLSTGQVVSSPAGHHGPVTCLAISSDDRYVISGSRDKTAVVWDLGTGKMLQRFAGHGDQVFGVAFSPDGKHALSGCGDFYTAGRGTVLVLWDVDTGSVYRTFEGHADGISCVAFSPDGERILSGGWDGAVKLWDVGVGRELQTFCGPKDGVCRVAFSPDGRRALSANADGAVHVWSARESGDLRVCAGLQGVLQTAAISPDGRLALAGNCKGARSELKLWDVATARQLSGWKQGADVLGVAISPDSRWCLAGLGNGQIVLHDLATDHAFDSISSHTSGVQSVAFSSDSSRFLSAGHDGFVRLWDTAQRTELRSFAQGISLRTVRFSPDDSLCAAAGDGPEVSVWNLASGKKQLALPAQQGEIKSVAWSSDGHQLFSASYEHTIKLWNLETQREVMTLSQSEPVFAIIFGPKDESAFSGHYFGGINVWELPTGREQRTLLAHGSSAMALAASADWSVLVSGGWDSQVRLWDFSRVADYEAFEPRLAQARQTALDEPQMLGSFGEWYAFRGAPDWAVDLLEEARNNGAAVSSLTLARCYWQLNDYDSARREFQRALDQKEAPESYLRLCLSAIIKPVVGYHIDGDEVVFEFEPAMYGRRLAPDAKVFLAGEFNHWLDNTNGRITNSYPQWVMQRMDDGHYTLHKPIADLRDRSQWQFRFVIDGQQWVEVPDSAVNRDELGGMANLILKIPPPTRKTSAAQN